MGAVYIYTGYHPTQRGQIVRGNYIHDIGVFAMQNGVYPDNGTMGVTIESNLFARIGWAKHHHPGRAVNNNSGAYVRTHDNFFVDCALPYLMSAHSGKKNHDAQRERWRAFFAKHPLESLPHVERYPELRRFWDEQRQFPDTNTFERNVVWNPSRKPAAWRRGGRTIEPVDGVVMEYPGLQCEDNWTARSNPGFTDPAEGDFTLRADAEALRRLPGMQPIDFRAVGPRADLP